jgi:polysaccharide pyruvyl transferase WcaK-like protein
MKFIIGRSEFFLGARMHACIAAISQGIPAVPIAYSNKFVGVMRSVGLEGAVVDPRRMELNEILQVVERTYDARSIIRRELKQRIPAVKRSIRTALLELGETPTQTTAVSGEGIGRRDIAFFAK